MRTSCSLKSEGTTATPVFTSISDSTDWSVGTTSGIGFARLRGSAVAAIKMESCKHTPTDGQSHMRTDKQWRRGTHFFRRLVGTAGGDLGVGHLGVLRFRHCDGDGGV
jgi:hypothetical protein